MDSLEKSDTGTVETPDAEMEKLYLEKMKYPANLNPASRTNPSSGGPGYLVSGGAGAPLDSCPNPSSKNCSAKNHYLVFEVNGNTVDVKVVMVSPAIKKKTD